MAAEDVDDGAVFFFNPGDAGLTATALVRGATRFSFIVVDLVVVVVDAFLVVAVTVLGALVAAVDAAAYVGDGVVPGFVRPAERRGAAFPRHSAVANTVLSEGACDAIRWYWPGADISQPRGIENVARNGFPRGVRR